MSKLTADKKICYTASFAILALLLCCLFIPTRFVRWSVAVALAIAAFVSYSFIKKRSIRSFNKKQVLMILSVSACLFVVLYYVWGLSVGFTKLYARFSFRTLFTLILPISLMILASEATRAVLLSRADKPVYLAAFCIGVLSEVFIAGGIAGLNTVYRWVDFIGITLFPAITSNILYNYVSKRYGFAPNAVYRLIYTLYPYFIPYVPAVQRVLLSMIQLFLPIALYLFISALFERKQRQPKEHKKKKWVYAGYGAGALVITLITMLVSCQFRFGMIVIASPSMTGEINKGDAVVYESYEHCEKPKEGDVIVFNKSGAKVVHRIIEEQRIDGELCFITKGDANEDPDAGYVTEDEVVGVVRVKLLYVGYPSLWLYELTK